MSADWFSKHTCMSWPAQTTASKLRSTSPSLQSHHPDHDPTQLLGAALQDSCSCPAFPKSGSRATWAEMSYKPRAVASPYCTLISVRVAITYKLYFIYLFILSLVYWLVFACCIIFVCLFSVVLLLLFNPSLLGIPQVILYYSTACMSSLTVQPHFTLTSQFLLPLPVQPYILEVSPAISVLFLSLADQASVLKIRISYRAQPSFWSKVLFSMYQSPLHVMPTAPQVMHHTTSPASFYKWAYEAIFDSLFPYLTFSLSPGGCRRDNVVAQPPIPSWTTRSGSQESSGLAALALMSPQGRSVPAPRVPYPSSYANGQCSIVTSGS